jgi:hypothetical protein
MNQFIGTKIIKAKPCKAWRQFGEWGIGADGYKVVYEDGYESWSPKDVFESSYRSVSGMNFGLAIEALKNGKKVARSGWNGKGMWLILVPAEDWNTDIENPTDAFPLPWIGMKTADNKFVPWLASQTDMLADDWQIV